MSVPSHADDIRGWCVPDVLMVLGVLSGTKAGVLFHVFANSHVAKCNMRDCVTAWHYAVARFVGVVDLEQLRNLEMCTSKEMWWYQLSLGWFRLFWMLARTVPASLGYTDGAHQSYQRKKPHTEVGSDQSVAAAAGTQSPGLLALGLD